MMNNKGETHEGHGCSDNAHGRECILIKIFIQHLIKSIPPKSCVYCSFARGSCLFLLQVSLEDAGTGARFIWPYKVNCLFHEISLKKLMVRGWGFFFYTEQNSFIHHYLNMQVPVPFMTITNKATTYHKNWDGWAWETSKIYFVWPNKNGSILAIHKYRSTCKEMHGFV